MRLVVTTLISWMLVGTAHAQGVSPASTSGTQQPAPPADAPPEVAVSWGAEVDVVSQYFWRGFPYSEGSVVWPSAWVSYKGFSANLWFNFDHQWDPKMNEYDITLSYARSVGDFTVTGSFLGYQYSDGKTKEVIGRVDYAIGPGGLFTTHAFDVGSYKGGYYAEGGYLFEHELNPKTVFSGDASFSVWKRFITEYVGDELGDDMGTFGPVTLNLALAYELAPHVSIRPHISFSRIPAGFAREFLNPPTVFGGVALRISY